MMNDTMTTVRHTSCEVRQLDAFLRHALSAENEDYLHAFLQRLISAELVEPPDPLHPRTRRETLAHTHPRELSAMMDLVASPAFAQTHRGALIALFRPSLRLVDGLCAGVASCSAVESRGKGSQ